ncbi:Tetratricopeptide repeat (TPR)-containing protein [Tripterygium wilfordii]|uniref:Tetratricopeptide repeat (TPR)-containing protein n=1 Tax=Tripterygium wilfordii TaxID=458696 RepID=A0A7J7DY78_TRIWF|nr:ethylene-overproduction protein 1-like [Tripterygium wilfordii]KAF5751342.1 Tetratricopeptide repeat (TPR)-containing protein [Tripterygium wilfordii]
MRGFKILDRFKSTQVHALCPSDIAKDGGSARIDNHKTISSGSKSKLSNPISVAQTLLSYGLPRTDLLEPPIDPHLKPIRFVESLADLHRRLKTCPQSDKSLLCIEQYAILAGLNDPKLLRRCLCSARQQAFDVHSKVVLSAWLRFERRTDELEGVSSMDCSGYILECPKAALISGYDLNLNSDHCQCCQDCPRTIDRQTLGENECLSFEEDGDVSFYIDGEEINCSRSRIATLSSPLKAMLYGRFVESKRGKIEFSRNGISVEGMRALEVYSRTRIVELFCPEIVVELLHFANRFCCEELKSACDAYLASLVCAVEDALILMDYGLEEKAHLLVASCLQVLLRELPNSLFDLKVMKILCSSEYMEKLAMVGHASFLLYYFLSQAAMEENMISNTMLMLLERMCECCRESWQKALAMHQLGCVMLQRNEYLYAQTYFEAAAQAGHTYSLAGIARAKYKQGQQNSAYRLVNSLIFEHKPAGWMYQERSLYSVGKEKIVDLNTATELDPTLTFPYKYRAVAQLEEKQIRAAISEIEKIIGFMLSPDCLELQAWFFIALEDYKSALTNVRALLTLEPNYKMLHGRLNGDYLVEMLSCWVQQQSQADCWAKLYERWSSVDDIGSLAVIHQMLANDPGKSLLRFRQSLLLLRLNCQKAAMRCLRLARNHSFSEHEKLVYEGWILYDTVHRDDALSKADASILIQRSFEAFFLKAYILADAALDAESSSYVIHLLEEALRCPSDVLRKGQALNNLGSIFVDCRKLDKAADCYKKALNVKHTRAHQGLARVYHLRNQRKAAYDEMTRLMEKAHNNASAYEKRSEYCDRDMAKNDLNMATQLDPLRTYPYRYRAAVLMDDQKDIEAVEELSKAIAFKPELQMLYLRAAFYESMGDLTAALQDCEAALCLDPKHLDTHDLYNRTRDRAAANQQT